MKQTSATKVNNLALLRKVMLIILMGGLLIPQWLFACEMESIDVNAYHFINLIDKKTGQTIKNKSVTVWLYKDKKSKKSRSLMYQSDPIGRIAIKKYFVNQSTAIHIDGYRMKKLLSEVSKLGGSIQGRDIQGNTMTIKLEKLN